MNMTMKVSTADGTVRQLRGYVRVVSTKPTDAHHADGRTTVVAAFRSYVRTSQSPQRRDDLVARH